MVRSCCAPRAVPSVQGCLCFICERWRTPALTHAGLPAVSTTGLRCGLSERDAKDKPGHWAHVSAFCPELRPPLTTSSKQSINAAGRWTANTRLPPGPGSSVFPARCRREASRQQAGGRAPAAEPAAGAQGPLRARGSRDRQRDAPYLAPRRAGLSGDERPRTGWAVGSAPTALAPHRTALGSAGLCASPRPAAPLLPLCCAAPRFIPRGVATQPSSPAASPHPSPGTDPADLSPSHFPPLSYTPPPRSLARPPSASSRPLRLRSRPVRVAPPAARGCPRQTGVSRRQASQCRAIA